MAVEPAASRSSRVAQLRARLADNRVTILLLAPTVCFIAVLLWGPVLRGLWMTLHSWPLVGDPEWVGARNYVEVLAWDAFHQSLVATAWYMTTTAFQVGVGVSAALAVAHLRRFRDVVSAVYLVAFTMPPVITALMWKFLLAPNFSVFFHYLGEWGVVDAPVYWAVDGTLALATVTGVASWTYWPFVFLVVYASRESIPESHYEAARVYGASRVQTLRRVTLPQLKRAILIVVALRFVWNLSKVALPLTLTNGGPGYATSIVGVLFYRLALLGELGRSYTVGVFMVVISLLGIALYVRVVRADDAGGSHG